MPVTLFAHQVPAMGLKFSRPKWFDGTALCIGSMVPDLAYSVSGYLHVDTHEWDGLWRLDVPLAIVITIIIRWSTANVAAAHLPDLGGFRLWSWRVIHRRQPAWWVTLTSCALGLFTHVFMDSFTHPGRHAARWLGYDDVVVHLWGRSEPLTSVLQVFGHTVGSLVGAWMLFAIGNRLLLERWYGAEAVAAVRSFSLSMRGRVVFWLLVLAGGVIGFIWGLEETTMVGSIERPLFTGMLGAMVASLLPVCRPRPTLAAPEPAEWARSVPHAATDRAHTGSPGRPREESRPTTGLGQPR